MAWTKLRVREVGAYRELRVADVGGRTRSVVLASAADVGRRFGVERNVVNNWARRDPSFPPEVTHVSRNPVYDLYEVEAWYRAKWPRRIVLPLDQVDPYVHETVGS